MTIYTLSMAYVDVEQILKRPLNSIEYETIAKWFETYDPIHIKNCIGMLKGYISIRTANFITTVISKENTYYHEMIKNMGLEETQKVRTGTISDLDFSQFEVK